MDRRKIAHWRYEEIADLLDDSLTGRERSILLKRIARAPVRWPSGLERPISEATLYRWLRSYQKGGLERLMPQRHRRRKRSKPLKRSVVERAVALLREEPRRSLTMLLALLKAERRGSASRSTLHRRLQAHRAYPGLRRLARGNPDHRLRRRFQTTKPHMIWQCDAKGPFRVRLWNPPRVVLVHVMTILDDFSRATLSAIVVETPDLRAAVLVFRAAARRWGLPRRFYADRASIFDSKAFRAGLAEFGVNRIPTQARNAPARGKIEAYHRIIESWFIRELRHERVQDLDHLLRLLTAVLESVYMDHRHRTLKKTPREALLGVLSERQVSLERLSDAFLLRTTKRAHPKTGEVELGGELFKVPREFAGRKLDFAFDPVDSQIAFLQKENGTRVRLRPAIEKVSEKPAEEARGSGRLQALYDHWQGRRLPQAQAGFGLPEIFELFEKLLGRKVPRDEEEARLLQDFYREKGPMERQATEKALRRISQKLGPKRPLATYLTQLASKIVPPQFP